MPARKSRGNRYCFRLAQRAVRGPSRKALGEGSKRADEPHGTRQVKVALGGFPRCNMVSTRTTPDQACTSWDTVDKQGFVVSANEGGIISQAGPGGVALANECCSGAGTLNQKRAHCRYMCGTYGGARSVLQRRTTWAGCYGRSGRPRGAASRCEPLPPPASPPYPAEQLRPLLGAERTSA